MRTVHVTGCALPSPNAGGVSLNNPNCARAAWWLTYLAVLLNEPVIVRTHPVSDRKINRYELHAPAHME
jgi:hypothetical protein